MVRIKVKRPKKSSFLGERRSALHLQRRSASCNRKNGIFARAETAAAQILLNAAAQLGKRWRIRPRYKKKFGLHNKGGLDFLQKRDRAQRRRKLSGLILFLLSFAKIS